MESAKQPLSRLANFNGETLHDHYQAPQGETQRDPVEGGR